MVGFFGNSFRAHGDRGCGLGATAEGSPADRVCIVYRRLPQLVSPLFRGYSAGSGATLDT
jgi:hypothetical protein